MGERGFVVKRSCKRGIIGGSSPISRRRSAWPRQVGRMVTALGLVVLAFLIVPLRRTVEASELVIGTRTARPNPETLEGKIQELSVPATAKASSYHPIVITEAEANTYLQTQGPTFLPPAVQNPQIQIRADHLSVAADVDFDMLRQIGKQTNDIGMQVVGTLFKGKQKVSATGKLTSGDGQAQVTIQDLSVGDTSIPDWLTRAMVENYLEKSYNLDISKPFSLPDHVTRIDLSTGKATFVRSPNKKPAVAK